MVGARPFRVDGPPEPLTKELFENGVDERTAVHRADRFGVARVFEVAHAEHSTQEVRERAGGPLLQSGRRTGVPKVVGQFGPPTHRSRPLRELTPSSRPGRRQPAFEPGRGHEREVVDRLPRRPRSQELAQIELGGGRRRPCGGQPPLEGIDVLGLALELQDEGRRLLCALAAGVGSRKGDDRSGSRGEDCACVACLFLCARAPRSQRSPGRATRTLWQQRVVARPRGEHPFRRADHDHQLEIRADRVDQPPDEDAVTEASDAACGPFQLVTHQPDELRHVRFGPDAVESAECAQQIDHRGACPLISVGPARRCALVAEMTNEQSLGPVAQRAPAPALTRIGGGSESLDERRERIELGDPTVDLGLLAIERQRGRSGVHERSGDSLEPGALRLLQPLAPLVEPGDHAGVARVTVPPIGTGGPTRWIAYRRRPQQAHELVASMTVDRPLEQTEERAAGNALRKT